MRIPRPKRPKPWRWRPRRSDPDEASSRRNGHDEDVQLLRRTRLRLMGVSGVVMLVILVVLEGAVYNFVSDRIGTSARTQLLAAAGGELPSDDYSFSFVGPTAGMMTIRIDPSGTPIPPPNAVIPVW